MGYRSRQTKSLEKALEKARRNVKAEGRRAPDGSSAYKEATKAADRVFQKLHSSYAADRMARTDWRPPAEGDQ